MSDSDYGSQGCSHECSGYQRAIYQGCHHPEANWGQPKCRQGNHTPGLRRGFLRGLSLQLNARPGRRGNSRLRLDKKRARVNIEDVQLHPQPIRRKWSLGPAGTPFSGSHYLARKLDDVGVGRYKRLGHLSFAAVR